MTQREHEPTRPLWTAADLRALALLLHRGSGGVIDITEGLHQSVRRTLGLSAGASPDRCGGLSGRVYAAVRHGHGLLGRGLELIARYPERGPHPSAAMQAADPRRLAWLAALNGVCGDQLELMESPLAIRPSLRIGSAPAEVAQAPSHLLVLVHGLCMNDLQWSGRGDAGHGAVLAEALGALPVYFRYNSGLAIERNGGLLSEALEGLLRTLPQPPVRISLIGHSMGGLVARSAELQARQSDLPWRRALRDLVLLGTPNEGAPLERMGRAFQSTLARIPYAQHFRRVGAMRSRGILDLGEGRVLGDGSAPLATDLSCLVVAAQLGKPGTGAAARWLGDGLVPVDSALGGTALGRAADRELLLPRTGHLQLLQSETVRRALIDWLR
ncbi:esterase/lipase family protein [Aquimonas voraii]|uniref:PGAP1-like protein n=1 Tax=Aquimonas voraii TaxID=265719 RepID=A0A1G6UXC6_9GAMM|nr:hypothetical protein [Aquimonas voraii]SDD45901.1 PGAP1-like protein [Aquimonas voraii]